MKISLAPRPFCIDLKVTTGMAIRLAFLMTHYRKSMQLGATTPNASYAKIEEARKILRRWYMACEPTSDGPPIAVIQALENDLNTPAVIALMHKYRKTSGKNLFASLMFMGLIDGVTADDVHELKTLPDDHEWSREIHAGLETAHPPQ